MKLTITKVIKRDTDKEGNKLIGKNGRPYSRASIQTKEYGAEWLGGFWRSEIVEGAEIEAEVKEREYNGKTYRDFVLPKRENPTEFSKKILDNTEQILNRLVAIGITLEMIKAQGKKSNYPTAEDEGIDLSAIPFDAPVVEDTRDVPVEAYDDDQF